MNYPLETEQLGFFIGIGILGVACLTTMGFMIYDKFKEHQELEKWRKNLRKYDKVRVEGYQGEYTVYANHHNGKITLRLSKIHGNWYKSVKVDQIYPPLEKPEIEVV